LVVAPQPFEVVVPNEARGLRLDRFLADTLASTLSVTRSELQRWIVSGNVLLRGKPLEVSSRVRGGDVLSITPLGAQASSAIAEPDLPLTIVYEDESLLVVFKASGVVVHPAAGHANGTLVNALLGRGLFQQDMLVPPADAQSPYPDASHTRPGIVHRLDKDTSGLMVVARTPASREHLKRQFAVHSIGREYVALAMGVVARTTFSTLHARDPKDRMRFTGRGAIANGKRAITHVEPLEQLGPVALVKCTLQTGRTHQIRMHLSEAGSPIVGDALYRFKTKDPVVAGIAEALGHQALHARHLAFEHPVTGKRLVFDAEPEASFTRAVAQLRSAFSGTSKGRER
jgi:23S rRNA pseudouridine1911/1915/1917 synthase